MVVTGEMSFNTFSAWILFFQCVIFHNKHQFKEKNKGSLERYLRRCNGDFFFFPYPDLQAQMVELQSNKKMRLLKHPLWPEATNIPLHMAAGVFRALGEDRRDQGSGGSLSLPWFFGAE